MTHQIRSNRNRVASLALRAFRRLHAGLEAQWANRRRYLAYKELAELPDYLLADIGVTRSDVLKAQSRARRRRAAKRRKALQDPECRLGHGWYSKPAPCR